ncbi:unnamed protein product [Schistosoma margrebowiei]|uniref:Uncharacterized protein n=1 Tax=Schistosoma margrebowiei TaxID=48269 RepID=A0A183MJ58_9TREM|nr:unnamed protein product [Schistosoma margrebowiei]
MGTIRVKTFMALTKCHVMFELTNDSFVHVECSISNSKYNTFVCAHLCFKCGGIGHIQSVCNDNVHLIATNIKPCNSDSTKSSIHNDYLSLSTILKDSADSYSSSELNETQDPCETTVSNQSIYQNPHVIVPDIAFPNDSHIFDEIPCKYEENMLSEHNYD